MSKREVKPQIIVDTREQLPYRFPDDVRQALDVADYSAVGVEHLLRMERKSLKDLLGCIGGGRERFKRSLDRMKYYPMRYLILELTLENLVDHVWKDWHIFKIGKGRITKQEIKITPRQVIGSVFSWSEKFGVIPIFAGQWNGRGRELGRGVVWKLSELALRHEHEIATEPDEASAAISSSTKKEAVFDEASNREGPGS